MPREADLFEITLIVWVVSHGFAVIIPEHLGSDRQKPRDFYQGLYPENFLQLDKLPAFKKIEAKIDIPTNESRVFFWKNDKYAILFQKLLHTFGDSFRK